MKGLGKDKSRLGKMDIVLSDTHLDTRMTLCILINVIVPRRTYAGEVMEADAEDVKQLERLRMAAAKKTPQ